MATNNFDGGVSLSLQGPTGRVEFWSNKGNSLSSALLGELARAISSLSAERALTSIVLSSRGEGAFCGGAALHEARDAIDSAARQQIFSGFGALILAIVRSPKIVVARVHGKIVGGGVGVVSACDIALASRAAQLRLSELSLGLGPFVIGPAVERRIGSGPFSALSLDGQWRDAEWAERHGLYAAVEDSPAALDRRLGGLEQILGAYDPEIVGLWKRTLTADTADWEALLAHKAAQVAGITQKTSI